jgi:hypothetical protein
LVYCTALIIYLIFPLITQIIARLFAPICVVFMSAAQILPDKLIVIQTSKIMQFPYQISGQIRIVFEGSN